MSRHSSSCPIVGLAIFVGALFARDTRSAQGNAEDAVKVSFGQLQAALKTKDAPKIWELLDSATQADAARTAKIIKAAYKRATAKYDEIPTSKIISVTLQGDNAVLNYLEADGDKEKFNYSRQGGKWKVALPMPPFSK
jgi:hypothetical protein